MKKKKILSSIFKEFNKEHNQEHVLIEGGSEYFRDSFFTQQEVDMNYNENSLITARYKLTGKPFYFDLSDAVRIGILGLAGSGKTYTIRSIIDRSIKAGYCGVFANDVKDELKSSLNPVQYKFQSTLFQNEKPTALKVATLRPTFFKQLIDDDDLSEAQIDKN